MRQLFTVCDVETTGLDPVVDKVVELGWCHLLNGEISAPYNMLVNPGRKIPPEASAVHHIIDEDVATAMSLGEVASMLTEDADAIFVAQNNRFDEPFLRPVIGPRVWIDTLRCARRLWPEAPGYSNQVLRYWLNPEGLVRELAEPSHRAGPDAYVTAHLLREQLKLASVEQLIAWSNEPALLTKCGFGKHRGTPWKDIPADYLQWILRQADMDEDVLFTARYWIEQRRNGAGL
jgi:exodeoxyribonuclease X